MADDERTEHNILVGRRLAAFRGAIGLDQDSLAALLDSTRQRLSHWENGHRTLPPAYADRIWRTWGVSPNYFYSGLLELVPDRYRAALANLPDAPTVGRPRKIREKKIKASKKAS